MKGWRAIALAVGIVVALIVVLDVIALATKSSSETSSVRHGTVLVMRGTENQQSRFFTVPDQWSLSWSYRCSDPEYAAIWVKDSGGIGIDHALASTRRSGHGTTQMHQGGRLYLSWEGSCSHTVTVRD